MKGWWGSRAILRGCPQKWVWHQLSSEVGKVTCGLISLGKHSVFGWWQSEITQKANGNHSVPSNPRKPLVNWTEMLGEQTVFERKSNGKICSSPSGTEWIASENRLISVWHMRCKVPRAKTDLFSMWLLHTHSAPSYHSSALSGKVQLGNQTVSTR